ncbi:MAG: aspartate-semialdehyde dehydrogenase, partial [Desulfobaccales bacterium]
YALASSNSVGKRIPFKGGSLKVEDLETFDFSKAQIGLFSPGASVSEIYAPKAAAAGCIVIDNTSQFRYDDDIPLVVPEVNPEKIADYKNRGIIANPNCSTIQMLVALKPIYDAVGIDRINVCTYQAVSGTGKEAILELANQTSELLNAKPITPSVYPKQIAFNVLPQIDVFMDNGYTKEEMKMVNETKKIMGDDTIQVTATTVRVPVFYSHSEAVNIETARKLTPVEARDILAQAPGVKVVDDPLKNQYPMPIDAAGQDLTLVGRIREDFSIDNGLNFWVVADNLRKGAATNAVQIAEILIRDYLRK